MEDFKKTYFNNLRKLIGLIGLLMPIALLAYTLPTPDCNKILNSISAYYHSKAGHIFSACSLVIGVVLYNTIKYDEDKWLYRAAALLCVAIGFVPNLQPDKVGGCIIRANDNPINNYIHLGSAITFFVLLSYLVYFRFTKSTSEANALSLEKKKRNRIFKTCGILMLATMVMIFIYWKCEPNGWDKFRPIFVGETLMLAFFSIAWLVKGQFWVSDKA